MTATMAIAVLVSVALLASLFWLIWRRGRPGAEEKYLARAPASSGNPVEESADTLEIERTPATPAAVQSRVNEEQSRNDLELPEKGRPPDAPAAAAAESQSTESHLFGKTDVAEDIAESQNEAHEEL